jgi:hypothetical protein
MGVLIQVVENGNSATTNQKMPTGRIDTGRCFRSQASAAREKKTGDTKRLRRMGHPSQLVLQCHNVALVLRGFPRLQTPSSVSRNPARRHRSQTGDLKSEISNFKSETPIPQSSTVRARPSRGTWRLARGRMAPRPTPRTTSPQRMRSKSIGLARPAAELFIEPRSPSAKPHGRDARATRPAAE